MKLLDNNGVQYFWNKIKAYVDAKTPIVVHLQDNMTADYTFAQIITAIENKQWVILKYGNDTFTVYTRNSEVVIWQSTIFLNSGLGTRMFTLTNQNQWYIQNEALSLNDIKPIIVHVTNTNNTVTADYTFTQLNNAIVNQSIEVCYNGNHLRMTDHNSSKITFESIDMNMDTGTTTQTIIQVTNANIWSMYEDTYVPLKEDKLLYSNTDGLLVDGTVNSTYVDTNGNLITTGSSGEWDAWNITGMDLSAFRFIRFLCVRDTSNTGGTWICDVPLHVPIQTSASGGFFVSSGQMSSFGDRNRWNVAQCGVKGDKTAIALGQVFSLYGTAATTVNGIKICAVYGVY